MGELVYISGPYTEGVWEINVREAILAADEIHRNGHTPFIPHAMTSLWALVRPKMKDEWIEIDLQILSRCDALVRLAGTSDGAEIEVEYAHKNDIPVYHGVEEFLDQ